MHMNICYQEGILLKKVSKDYEDVSKQLSKYSVSLSEIESLSLKNKYTSMYIKQTN